MDLSVKSVRIDVLPSDSDVTVTRQEQSRRLQKETANFFLEALLEEDSKGLLRGTRKSIQFGWVKQSIQKVCRGGGSRRTKTCGSISVKRWTIRLQSSNKGGEGSKRKLWKRM